MALLAARQSPAPVSETSPAARPSTACEPGTARTAQPPPKDPAGRCGTAQAPDWWPYSREFPHWHVWRGVAGLLYARRPRSSPPKWARASDAEALRERIIRAETAA